MGQFFYDSVATPHTIEDRALVHLRAAIVMKLRGRESFLFTIDDDGEPVSYWMDSSIPVRFRLDTTDHIPLNRRWLDALVGSANSGSGLHLVDEPAAEPASDHRPMAVR
jgi:hypothetical protein